MSVGGHAGGELLPAILAAPARAVSHAPAPLRASASLLFATPSPRPSPNPLSLGLRLLHARLLGRDLLLGLLGLLLALAAAWLRSWLLLVSLLLSWGCSGTSRSRLAALSTAGVGSPLKLFGKGQKLM